MPKSLSKRHSGRIHFQPWFVPALPRLLLPSLTDKARSISNLNFLLSVGSPLPIPYLDTVNLVLSKLLAKQTQAGTLSIFIFFQYFHYAQNDIR